MKELNKMQKSLITFVFFGVFTTFKKYYLLEPTRFFKYLNKLTIINNYLN